MVILLLSVFFVLYIRVVMVIFLLPYDCYLLCKIIFVIVLILSVLLWLYDTICMISFV